MLEGWGLRWARGTPSTNLGLCALGLLGACSVINQFDDVKPSSGAATSTPTTQSTTQGGGGSRGSSGSGDGTRGPGTGGTQPRQRRPTAPTPGRHPTPHPTTP